MVLKTQIILLFFSFIFGAFFSFMLTLNYKFIYGEKKVFNILTTFSFVLVNTLIYFLILKQINNGILHPYSIICIILGFLFDGILQKKVAKVYKK